MRLIAYIQTMKGKVELRRATRFLISDVNIDDVKKVFDIARRFYDIEITQKDDGGVAWVILQSDELK